MLTSDEWKFLQELISILGPFEEATQYLGGEKYVTYSIMHPIIKEIKRLLLTSTSSFTLPNISRNLEIEDVDDVFTAIEEVETLESEENTNKNNNNQRRKSKIDLNKLFETKDILDKVKKCLYDAI